MQNVNEKCTKCAQWNCLLRLNVCTVAQSKYAHFSYAAWSWCWKRLWTAFHICIRICIYVWKLCKHMWMQYSSNFSHFVCFFHLHKTCALFYAENNPFSCYTYIMYHKQISFHFHYCGGKVEPRLWHIRILFETQFSLMVFVQPFACTMFMSIHTYFFRDYGAVYTVHISLRRISVSFSSALDLCMTSNELV